MSGQTGECVAVGQRKRVAFVRFFLFTRFCPIPTEDWERHIKELSIACPLHLTLIAERQRGSPARRIGNHRSRCRSGEFDKTCQPFCIWRSCHKKEDGIGNRLLQSCSVFFGAIYEVDLTFGGYEK